jgi:hypothetical protein
LESEGQKVCRCRYCPDRCGAHEPGFQLVNDTWRGPAYLPKLSYSSQADGFLPSLKLECREALWAIKALRDEPLPLLPRPASELPSCQFALPTKMHSWAVNIAAFLSRILLSNPLAG